MKRFILTGTPGSGKTTLLRRLAGLGYATTEEAATAVIAEAQAAGEPEPWTDPSFLDRIVAVQARPQPPAPVRFFDRSPVCTHALAVYLGHPLTPALLAELDRITRDEVYDRRVLFVRNLGFCEPTEARRITFEESLRFEELHERSYRAFGFQLVDVPAAPVEERLALIRAAVL
ncbi:AAA family ATPase [Nonomuraea sp. NPDC050328]|uniref:AAA family ATPase n=1 Tax=Nonomuraea sp. NPDC050328 TaxID=3364361 RepID=UPI00379645C2